MDREAFRARITRYKLAKLSNPNTKLWDIPKYYTGTGSVGEDDQKQFDPRISPIDAGAWIGAQLSNIVKKKPSSAWEFKDLTYSADEFIRETWANENPRNVGLRDGLYYPHKSPEGGAKTIGPGFKLNDAPNNPTTELANAGMTLDELNSFLMQHYNDNLNAVRGWLQDGMEMPIAVDTISPQIINGLMDMRHQLGSLGSYKKLRKAVIDGNLREMQKQSATYYKTQSGRRKRDIRRQLIRNKKYFHY